MAEREIQGSELGIENELTHEPGVAIEDKSSREYPDDVDIEVLEIPLPLRLHPTKGKEINPLSDKILNECRACFQLSNRTMSEKRSQMSQKEKQMWAYVPTDDWKPDNTTDVPKRKQEQSAVFPGSKNAIMPVSFVIWQQIQTYILQCLFGVRPFMQLKGGSMMPLRTRGAELFEQVLHYQTTSPYIRDLLLMYYWTQDLGMYNMAVLRNIWRKDYLYEESENKPDLIEKIGQLFGISQENKKELIPHLIYEGNQTYLEDPKLFFPDTRVPLWRLNDGEFCGSLYYHTFMTLKMMEKQQYYFNIDYIDNNAIGSIIDENLNVGQGSRSAISKTTNSSPRMGIADTTTDPLMRNMTEIATLQKKVIPREYQFSTREYPEIWNITIANNNTIIGAEKSKNPTGQFDYIVTEYLSQGHEFSSKGLLDMLEWGQDYMSWLYNSRRMNVAAVMNGEFLLDPAMVDVVQFKKSEPGKYFRLKQSYAGSDLTNKGVRQIDKKDTTMSHPRDSQLIFEFLNLLAGTTPTGRKGNDRKTATQFRTEMGMDYQKLQIFAKVIEDYGLVPWVTQCIAQTQKNLKSKNFYDIVGRGSKNIDPKRLGIVEVGPEDIAGRYFYRKKDGNIPLDRQGELALDAEMMKLFIGNPQAGKMFGIDIRQFFIDFCYTRGKTNIEEYMMTPQVVSDEEALKRAEAGDLKPLLDPRVGAPQPPVGGQQMIEGAGNNTAV